MKRTIWFPDKKWLKLNVEETIEMIGHCLPSREVWEVLRRVRMHEAVLLKSASSLLATAWAVDMTLLTQWRT